MLFANELPVILIAVVRDEASINLTAESRVIGDFVELVTLSLPSMLTADKLAAP